MNCNIHTYNIVYNANGIRAKAERLYSSSPYLVFQSRLVIFAIEKLIFTDIYIFTYTA